MFRYLTYFGERLIHNEFTAPQPSKVVPRRKRRERPVDKTVFDREITPDEELFLRNGGFSG